MTMQEMVEQEAHRIQEAQQFAVGAQQRLTLDAEGQVVALISTVLEHVPGLSTDGDLFHAIYRVHCRLDEWDLLGRGRTWAGSRSLSVFVFLRKNRRMRKEITSTYHGTCRLCGAHVSPGERVYYDPAGARGKKIEHVSCPTETGTQASERAGLVVFQEPYREMVARFESVCPLCVGVIAPGSRLWYYPHERVATHLPGECDLQRIAGVPVSEAEQIELVVQGTVDDGLPDWFEQQVTERLARVEVALRRGKK